MPNDGHALRARGPAQYRCRACLASGALARATRSSPFRRRRLPLLSSAPQGSPGSTSTPCQHAGVEGVGGVERSEEHTSELQSRGHLVCRLLLEKKKESSTSR